MNVKNFVLTAFLIGVLTLNACVPAIRPATPTATIEPSPTPRPEKNVALLKPVRVSASWVVDPPERAVNGNLNDWWGAGGPAPQWIEVDLEGLYSVSMIRIINEGPTGQAVYRVLGRSPGTQNQLLYTFDGYKSQNQRLEYSPETPWPDIATIRIEIMNGSGWAGFREVQVFSRDDPKPLPALTETTAPLFLAQVKADALAQITPENAVLMKPLAILGRGPINELAWSPDGKTLAAASPLGIWLYDPAALNSPPRLLEGHTRDVLTVAFSPDGTIVLSASQDGTVKQWDSTTGELKRTIYLWNDFSYEVGNANRNKEVWSIAFSPDCTLLAAGGYDGTLRLWNINTRVPSGLLKGHMKAIDHLAFSPDGALLASSSVDGAIYVWDVKTNSQRASLSAKGQIQSLVFSPDGKTLAYGGAGMNVRLWDTATSAEQAELSEHNATLSLAFSPDSSTLASSSLNRGAVVMWDAESDNSRIFREGAGWIMNMAYSPDGKTLATYAWDGTLRLWETATGLQSASLTTHTSPINSVAFSPDGLLLATGDDDNAIRLWEVETNSLHSTLRGHLNKVTGVAFSPNGQLLASSSFDHTVRLWDVATGVQVAVLQGHESLVRCVAFSPDGKTVASGSTDKTVRLWDVATGKERAVLNGHTGEVESVAFSSDGVWLLSGSVDKTLRIWEAATGKEVGVLQGNLSSVLGAAFSPDGTLIASVGGDHSLRALNWEISSSAVTARDQFLSIGHPGWVLSVTFSPDGKIVASSNLSTTAYYVTPGEIHLYSPDSGFPLALLRGHTKRVTSIAFSPDGKLLASGSADGSVRLWGVAGNGSSSGSSQSPQVTPSAPTSTPKPADWDPFVGEWTATDPADGSGMNLTIMRSDDGNYHITLIDDGSRGCGLDGAGRPKFGIEIVLTAKAIGSTLNATSTSITCLSTPASPLNAKVSQNFLYQEATDTLWDDANQTNWKRK